MVAISRLVLWGLAALGTFNLIDRQKTTIPRLLALSDALALGAVAVAIIMLNRK